MHVLPRCKIQFVVVCRMLYPLTCTWYTAVFTLSYLMSLKHLIPFEFIHSLFTVSPSLVFLFISLIANLVNSCLFYYQTVESATEHCVFDIVLLLILHSCGFKKPVESLFRSKILSGQLTEVLLESAFKSHGDVSDSLQVVCSKH